MQTFITSKGDTVVSIFDNDADAVEALGKSTNLSRFGADLIGAHIRGRLTINQRPWLHKLAMELVNPAPAPKAEAEGLTNIVGMFTHALGHLKRPKLTFALASGMIRIAMAGSKSRYAGDLFVTDGGPFRSNKYFGRITQSGEFMVGRNAEAWVTDMLTQLNANPADFAAKYGKASGACCFCALTLTDPESVKVGYGPVCAKHYGLTYGKAKRTRKAA